MKPNIPIIFIALLCTFQSFSQIFTGKIVSNSKQPLENVYVYNKNTNSHTHTNINGDFVLDKTNIGDTIEIAILGYIKKQLVLTQSNFNAKNMISLEPKIFVLDELMLTNKIDPIQTIIKIDLANNPVNSSQQILQKVPGLFIGQHAGGGKAEQIFLRGFDIDHGTDLSLSVD